tara:strand:+ start:5348 stop:6295 length:948 start_codon:yes stop_codon:yes gene_type:complete
MIKNPSIWLIGPSDVAKDYLKVLYALKRPPVVIGRSKRTSELFSNQTGIEVVPGGVVSALKSLEKPDIAIVTVGRENLDKVALDLVNFGVKRILLEKPGGLKLQNLKKLERRAISNKISIHIAYNRRFYQSVLNLKKMILKEGGPVTCHFDFSERSKIVEKLNKEKIIKERWLLSNSSHVIDLFIHLCGYPEKLASNNSGSLSWHSSSQNFSGSGITKDKVLFSYNSNWLSPGSWSLELTSKKRRYLLKPLETLNIMESNYIFKPKSIRSELDIQYKPGFYLQIKKYLEEDLEEFCDLESHLLNFKIYNKIASYK